MVSPGIHTHALGHVRASLRLAEMGCNLTIGFSFH